MKIVRPDYNAAELEQVETFVMNEDARIENVHVQNGDFALQDLTGIDIREAILEDSIFMQANLDKVQMMDVLVRSSDMSAAQCADSSFIRVSFAKSRMNGLDMSKAVVRDVLFSGCQLDLANFRFTKFLRVRFEDCTLVEADFLQAELHQVTFVNCTIEKTVYDQVKVKKVDFSGSTIVSLSGWSSLRGATIDSVQLATVAPQIVAEIGIQVV